MRSASGSFATTPAETAPSPSLAGPYCIDDHADDSLLDRLGIGRAHLVGLSLGAMTARGSGPATPSGSTGSPCSAPAPSGRPASAWTDRAATVRAGGSAAIAKAVVERWFTSEFLAAHPDVRAAHEAMVAAISAFAEPRTIDRRRSSAWQHTHRLLIESGMAPGAADGALARGIALQAEKFPARTNPLKGPPCSVDAPP